MPGFGLSPLTAQQFPPPLMESPLYTLQVHDVSNVPTYMKDVKFYCSQQSGHKHNLTLPQPSIEERDS